MPAGPMRNWPLKLRQATRSAMRLLASSGPFRGRGQEKYFLGVYAVLRDEAGIIREWMETHVREGVEHFYLVDHGSRDDWRSRVSDFIARGMVSVLRSEEGTADQARFANCSMALRECHWLMVQDLDEFTHARRGPSVASYLKTLPRDVSQVEVPWCIFGTGGNLSQPHSVVRACRLRENLLRPGGRDWHAKSIVRPSRLLHFRNHRHEVLGRTIAPLPDAPSIGSGVFIPEALRARAGEMLLLQNHYHLQSSEDFQRKASKPDPEVGRPGAKFNQRYFEATEAYANEVRDEFLYHKYADLYDGLAGRGAPRAKRPRVSRPGPDPGAAPEPVEELAKR